MLRLLLPEALREAIDGDLEERLQQRARAGGSSASLHLWYVRQVLGLRYGKLRRAARDLTADAPDPRRRRPRGALVNELQGALRSLRARPGVAILVVVTLTLAIGITTSVFSVVNGVLLRPLPYAQPERVVNVYQTHGPWMEAASPQLRAFASRFPLSYPIFEGWRDRNTVFDGFGAYTSGQFTHVVDGRPEIVRGSWVTAGTLPALGVSPELGRLPLPSEDEMGSQPVVVLSHGFWQRGFGGDRSVVGRAIRFDDQPYEVVGVMPEGFYFPNPGTEVWVTFDDDRRARGIDSQFMNAVARIREDTDHAAAVRELASLQPQIHDDYGEPLPEGRGARVESRLDEMVGDVRQTLLVLMASVGVVLAVACGNIANLLFVSGLTRRREFAVRSALGASAGRLVGALFAETALLVLLGGALGVGLAVLAHEPLVDLLPSGIPRRDEIALSGSVLAFSAVITLLTTLVVGSLPAFLATRTDAAAGLKEGSRGSGGSRGAVRVRAALVVGEVALAFVLLVAAGLLANSFWRLSRVDLGFQHEHVATVQLVLPDERYPSRDSRVGFVSELTDGLAGLPGVVGVATTTETPFAGSVSSGTVHAPRPGGEAEEFSLELSSVSEDYFRVLGIPVKSGRAFGPADMEASSTAAILSEGAAQLLWPGEDPIGKAIGRGNDTVRWLTVVGVVSDVHHASVADTPVPKLYTPLTMEWQRSVDWIIGAAGDPSGILDQARSAVWAVDPGLPISQTMLVSDAIDRTLAEPRFRAILIGSLAGLAGLLAVLGVSGVVAFVVSQRVPEIGIRLALGASPGAIVGRITRSGFGLGLLGIAIGLGIALPSARALEEMLFGVGTRDPETLLGIVAAVLVVTASASWWPARRAARVDPVSVLNTE